MTDWRGVTECDHDPDIRLMLKIQQGSSSAYHELVDRYWSRVFGRFFRQFGDRHQAEDLAQDVFLRLYRSRHRYRPTAQFNTWIFHIARNVARNALRSLRRRPLRPVGDLTEENGTGAMLVTSQLDEPARPLERAELAGQVREAMKQLIDRQRAALELQYDEDQSYAEIARELDMTPKAAKSLLYRARNQLRDRLAHLIDPTD